MTKKDFKIIAEVIKETAFNRDIRYDLAVAFANALQKTNPRFDRAKFFEACNAY